MARILVALFFLMTATIGWSLDNTIRVLGVTTKSVNNDVLRDAAKLSLSRVVDGWNSSGLPSKSGVTITLVNNGDLVPLDLFLTSSTVKGKAIQARDAVDNSGLRNLYQADIVFAYHNESLGGGAGNCGFALQDNWIKTGGGNFTITEDGLDLTGRYLSYLATVNLDCYLTQFTSAHELGHLLGAAHIRGADGDFTNHPGLYPDSHAWIHSVESQAGSTVLKHATLLVSQSHCTGERPCIFNTRYSDNAFTYGNESNQNVKALVKTAKSVANYHKFTGPLKKPGNVVGQFLWCPDPSAGTAHHSMTWDDGGGGIEPDEYQIWTEQPINTGYSYDWSVEGNETYTDLFVTGAAGRARVRACLDGICTGLSNTYYHADMYMCYQPGW